jgi:phytoene dehydrogenase-like protein
MSETFDVIVVGAGHNGLSAAATLARAGKRVCVVEKADVSGGMARSTQWSPQARGPQIAHLLYNLSPVLCAELGLRFETKPLQMVALSPTGDHAILSGEQLSFADGTSHPQAIAFAALRRRLTRFAALLEPLSTAPPPSMEGARLGEVAGLAKLGLNLKRLGKSEMREFLRIILSNAYDLLIDELGDGPVAGALAADAVRGAFSGPRAPGSVFSLLYRLGQGGTAVWPMGGMDSVIGALEQSAVSSGALLRHGSGVARVTVSGDRVSGVTLDDGSTLVAPAVLSSLGAFPTMQLAGPQHYDIEAVRRLRALRAKGTAAKLNLVLRGVPDVPGLTEAQKAGRLIMAPSAAHVEKAFNPVKYGEVSDAPVMEAILPSLIDPTLCSKGRHVMSVIAQYVPYAPEGGWTDAKRAALSERLTSGLERHMPGLSALIEKAELLVPDDIEALTGAPGGHWHHAELSIDQLLTVRPVNGLARYAFGPEGYYLCGASAHPGGDLTGLPGRNAARQFLDAGKAR